MIAAQRRSRIAEIVRADGAASISTLAGRLGVSLITVRRDLDYLDSLGIVERTHGGAIVGAQPPESPYAEKVTQAAAEKASIARVASGLVNDGEVVVLGPGTTTEALALALSDRRGLTLVTNSVAVADAFLDSPHNQVILTGGTLRGSIRALVGDAAVRTFRGIHADRAFLSGNGLDPEFGLSTPDMVVAEVDRAIAGSAASLVIVADHTKLGARTAVQTVPIEEVREVVTDSASTGSVRDALVKRGVVLHVAT